MLSKSFDSIGQLIGSIKISKLLIDCIKINQLIDLIKISQLVGSIKIYILINRLIFLIN